MSNQAKWPLVLALCLIGLSIVPSAGAATTIFGPRSYALGNGSPTSFNDTFTADLSDTCDGKAVYFINIVTGDGQHGVASGSVTLNGTILVSEKDLSNAPQTIEREVVLSATNSLQVALKGGNPGAAMTITVRREIEETSFGAKSYSLATKSASFNDSFTVSDVSSPYFLVLRNGAADGTRKVASAVVSVNGVVLIGINDLRDASLLRVPVTVSAGANSLHVDLRGDVGATASVAIKRRIDESSCTTVGVNITSPSDHSTITTRQIVVHGTAIGPPAIGVSVNGVGAQTDSSHAGTVADPYAWVATLKAASGPVTITATATAPNGRTQTDSIAITFAPTSDHSGLAAFPPSGAAPFDTTLVLNVDPKKKITLFEVDADGDGVFETSSASAPDRIPAHFASTGVYEPSVRMTDAGGNVTRLSTAVVVENFAKVDEIIHGRWQGFIDALKRSDIEGALAYFIDEATRIKYRRAFNGLKPNLPQVADDIAEIRAVSIRGDVAQYLVTLPRNGQTYGYHVYFERGIDGAWRLVQF